jgi:cell division protein ZapA
MDPRDRHLDTESGGPRDSYKAERGSTATGGDTAGAAISPEQAANNLAVDIYDQTYYLRGPDPEYMKQLAALVDAKMRAVALQGAMVDSLRVAVLAALNIADELVALRQQQNAVAGNMARSIKSRTDTLAEMLDAALESNRKAG